MTSSKTQIASLLIVLGVAGCGGGGDDSPSAPPLDTSGESFTATLVDLRLERSADQRPLPVSGVPAAGGTLTVP
jgi:hypothetical protein